MATVDILTSGSLLTLASGKGGKHRRSTKGGSAGEVVQGSSAVARSARSAFDGGSWPELCNDSTLLCW